MIQCFFIHFRISLAFKVYVTFQDFLVKTVSEVYVGYFPLYFLCLFFLYSLFSLYLTSQVFSAVKMTSYFSNGLSDK
jgi:hypothetical protein